ncbi:MAG: nucleoside-triphosphatase [Planctomycetota bacterium]
MIHLITGEVHSGKTSLLKEAVALWRGKGFPLAGFFSESKITNGEIIGYDLIDVKGQTRTPYIRIQGEAGWPRSGCFFFIPDALEKACALIRNRTGADLLIVDEVGPLEMKGLGLWPALEQALLPGGLESVLVVRKKIAEEFGGMLNDAELKVYDMLDPDVIAHLTDRFESYLKRAE